MGINYRNEPIQFRLKEPDCDPAYVFSSLVGSWRSDNTNARDI